MANKLDYQCVKNINQPGRYTDSYTKGLQLLVKPSGTKYWLLRFTYDGKRRELGIGSFPDIPPKRAREIAYEARIKLSQGVNPIEINSTIVAKKLLSQILFKDFANECILLKSKEWKCAKHRNQWFSTMEKYVFPVIGNMPIDEVEIEHILQILNPIWLNKTETASRLRGRLEWIFAAAIVRKIRSKGNPALWKGYLQAILPAPNRVKEVHHYMALGYQELPNFISELQSKMTISSLALEFTILNASRTGEVINGLRSEIVDDVWVIPAEKMKAGKMHRVPLGPRSLEILSIARGMDLDSEYLFSINGKKLSNMAMSSILKRINPCITVHGFRSTFRDWVSEETNYSGEVAEMALAHSIKSKVEAAYRRRDLLDKRRSLMLDWEVYCCRSLSIRNIVNIRFR